MKKHWFSTGATKSAQKPTGWFSLTDRVNEVVLDIMNDDSPRRWFH